MDFHIITCLILKLPSFEHGDVIVNESYAACFYLEVSTPPQAHNKLNDEKS